MKTGRIIVDGDPIVYRAAFASQTTVYELVAEKGDTMVHRAIAGDPRDVIKELKADGYEIVERWHEVVPDTGTRLLEMMVDSQLKAIFKHGQEQLGVRCQMELILSGKGNYRNDVATIMGYKANRAKTEKPFYYKFASDYVKTAWSAYVVNGREADDEVSIRMRRAAEDGTPAILATIDKDLDQIPGWHYSYAKHVTYNVGKQEAMQLFFAQILCGDATDNIPGCIGLGEKRSKELVSKWVAQWEEGKASLVPLPEYLWRSVVDEYIQRGVKGYELPHTRGWEDVALEVARLVKLQEYPGQLWSPPGIADEIVEGNVDD